MAAQPYDPTEYVEALKQSIREGLAYSREVLAIAESRMREFEAAILESAEQGK
jgi:hypothetical protein